MSIEFIFYTGIKRSVFQKVWLHGAVLEKPWDEIAVESVVWQKTEMLPLLAEDRCPAFRVVLDFPETQAGKWFHWGVETDSPFSLDWKTLNRDGAVEAIQCCQIPQPHEQIRQIRSLSNHRYLGARNIRRNVVNAAESDGTDLRAHFVVWAPNAQKVELVFGRLWNMIDDDRKSLEEPTPRNHIAGGYVGDKSEGTAPMLGPFPMKRLPNGFWETDRDDPAFAKFEDFHQKLYVYRITKDDGSIAIRTDLYSFKQIGAGDIVPDGGEYTGLVDELSGSVSCSVVVDMDRITNHLQEKRSVDGVLVPSFPELKFETTDEFWKDEFDPERPVPKKLDDYIIYQLHIGALGFGSSRAGSLEDGIKLLDHLVELGVNAVELLPISEFAGGASQWGYATSHYFAVEYSCGGRDKFMYFVREAHRHGLAVIVDVVYNHFIHSGDRAEWMYDTNAHEKNPYYWYEGNPNDYREYDAKVPDAFKGHGGYLDNLSTNYAPRYYEEPVRRMFISSAIAFLEEFHVDGFRLDQTTSIHAYNVLHADGRPVARANLWGVKFLKEFTQSLKMVNPNVVITCEDHSNWDAVTKPVAEGGLGFDATWFADFHHHLNGANCGEQYAQLIPTAGYGGNDPLALDKFAGALAASGDHKIVYAISHDEAGNSGRDNPPQTRSHRTMRLAVRDDMVPETRRFAEARSKFAFGITATSAGTPMFLFGEEVGFTKDFLYNAVLENREDLYELKKNDGRFLFAFYREMIRFRREHSAMRSHNVDIVYVHDSDRVLVFRRWDESENLLVVASLNNKPLDEGYVVSSKDRLPDGRWTEIFNSDSMEFGGDGITGGANPVVSQAGEMKIVIPANAIVVLRKDVNPVA